METRYWVLEKALKIEDALSELIKQLIRIRKDNTKTLDHAGSSFNFMNKVNFIYDIDEIDRKTYNKFKTFGEVRNQFIHNIKVMKFLNLPEGENNLKYKILKNWDLKEMTEINLKNAFNDLQADIYSTVQILINEYKWGREIEIEKEIAFRKILNLDNILENTKRDVELNRKNNTFGILVDNAENKSDLEVFIELVKIKISSYESNIRLSPDFTERNIFSRKG